MESVEVWIVVRRYDKEQSGSTGNDVSSSLQYILLPLGINFTEVKSRIRSSIGLREDGNEVMKLRRLDGTLLTFSYLLHGNTKEKPLFLDVMRVNQSGIASARTALPPSYANIVRGKLASLEKRVERVESLVPELQSRRQADIEATLHQLGSKVHFLDKRLDELMPQDWKSHMELAPA